MSDEAGVVVLVVVIVAADSAPDFHWDSSSCSAATYSYTRKQLLSPPSQHSKQKRLSDFLSVILSVCVQWRCHNSVITSGDHVLSVTSPAAMVAQQSKGKKVKSGTCYSTSYMRQTNTRSTLQSWKWQLIGMS